MSYLARRLAPNIGGVIDSNSQILQILKKKGKYSGLLTACGGSQ